ncbi:MAG: SEL1-like repeat protein [[Clostridium] symbiosum]|nr:SEL1-like repeat protein [[Clostridium] symbiosum]
MAKSIVISKIRCASPNRKNTAVQTLNHLKYIATRPGVDLTPIKTSAGDDASIYLKYISERPRSHGLFGNLSNKKIGDLDALCKEMYQLSKQKVIYKGIVSLNEEDATRLGYTNKDSWNSLLNVAMPDIAHEFNIPIQNMSWVAAFHQEQGHPHIHYMLWRNDDKIASPFIHKSVQNRCRQIFSKYIFEADRELSVAIKTAARNELLDMSKELVGYPELSLESEGVLKITPKELSEVSALLFNLHPLLPTGRLNYKFLPPEVKKEVDSITEHILSYPAFESKYCEYVEACKKISASYSVVGKKAEHNLFSAEKELRTRLANIILKKVKTIPVDALMPDKNNMEDTGDGDIAIESMTQQRIGTQRARRHYDNSEIITPQPSDSHLTFLVNAEEPLEPDVHVHEEIGGNHKKSSSRSASKEYPYWTASYKLAKKALYSEEKKSPEQVADILALLEAEAQEKNPLALMELGKIFDKGMLEQEKAPNTASQYYTAGFREMVTVYESEKNNENKFLPSYFSYRIGKCCQTGIGTERDITAAKNWFRKSISMEADSPNAYAQYSLAKIYMQEYKAMEEDKCIDNEPQKTPPLDFTTSELIDLLTSASKTTPFAAFDLASLYTNGRFVEQNNEKAGALYAKALTGFLDIKNPDDSVYYKIGKMYADGLGTAKNPAAAAHYFGQAAEAKNIFASFALAKMYLSAESAQIQYKFHVDTIMTSLKEIIETENEEDLSLKGQSLYYLGLLHLKEDADLEQGICYLWQSADIEFELNKEHFALYKLANLHHYTQPEPPIDVEKLVTKLQKIYASEDEKQKEQAAYHLGLIHLKEGDFFDPSLAVKYLKEISKNSNNYSALFQLVKLHLYQPEKAEDITPDYLMTSLNKLVQDDVAIKQRNQALYYLALLHLQDDSELFNPLIANQYLWESATTGNTEERNYTALFQIAKLQLYKKEPAVIVTDTHRLLSELELLHEKSTDIILRYRAAYYLGLLYLQEESEQYNKAIGIEYLWLVAEAGIGSESASALFRLAKIQLREESDKSLIEPNKLIVALKRLNENPTEAEQSLNYHCRSAYYLGLLYLQEQSEQYSKADGVNYLWLAAKAEVGSESAFALFQLAKLHLKEDNETSSIEPDKLIVALKRLHENPSEGERNLNFHDQAAYYLGLLHLKEDSVLYDKALGIQYLWLAAETDNDSQSAFALFQLAKLRLKDDKNIESSFIDRNKLIVCLNTLYESPIAENEQNLHHHAQAAYYLGLFYLQEGSALYSPLKAIQYLWEASGDVLSEQSNPFALFKLVQLYLYSEDNAIVTNINSDKLVAFLNTLSNKAEEDELRMQALYLTALLHLKTDSKHYNIDIALSLLNPLADNGYTSAQASLGSFYLWGKHGRRDIKQGKMWLEKAAEQDYEPAKNQLEMYKNILQNKLIYSSYKLLNSMYTNLVFSSQNKQAYATERATESIKLQKERFRKNQIRSSYLE